MITLEVDGFKYEGFTEVTVGRNIEQISGVFNFATTSKNINLFPIKAMQPCKVFVGTTMVINGYVDSVKVGYDSGQHTITIDGRDRTCDLIDSTIVDVKEFQNMELIPIIEKVLSDNGLSDIEVINLAGDITAQFPDKIQGSSPISQTLFAFIESYARKRQVLLTTDGKGNITLVRAATGAAESSLLNVVNGIGNNIKSGTVTYDFKKRFNKYILQSSQNPTSMAINFVDPEAGEDEEVSDADAAADNEAVAVQSGTAIDAEIRTSRVTEVISKTTDSTVDLNELAEWTKNLAMARSIEYEVVVQDYYHDDAKTQLWQPNILVQVVDDFTDINATMLIKSVEYKLSLSTGSTTTITLVDQDSYTLQLQIESETDRKRGKRSNSLGDIVFNPDNLN